MKVLILRGIQGSGKTHFATKMALDSRLSTEIVSADRFFETPEGYRFDVTKLSQAHGHCMKRFIEALESKVPADVVLVDNTNVSAWEVGPYVLVAQAFKVEAAIYTIYCDAKVAAARQLHGVPEAGVVRKYEQLSTEKLPPMWRHYIDEDAAVDWLRS